MTQSQATTNAQAERPFQFRLVQLFAAMAVVALVIQGCLWVRSAVELADLLAYLQSLK
jgi:hypothetical protein